MTNKTLVCVHNLRASEVTWNNFKKNVLDNLDADLSTSIELNTENYEKDPFWENAKYRWICPKFNNWYEAVEYARTTEFPYADSEKWKKLISLPGNAFAPLNGWIDSGFAQMFSKWFFWYNLKKENIYEKYDRFIFTRTDYNFLCPHPPMDLLDPESIWLPNGENHTGYCDRHAVLSKKSADIWFSILKICLTETDDLYNMLYVPPHQWTHADGPHTERLHKVIVDSKLGSTSVKRIPYIMYLCREAGWKEATTHRFHKELGHYIRNSAEFELSKNFENFYKTKEDWYTKGF
jgi:hypothetical protein